MRFVQGDRKKTAFFPRGGPYTRPGYAYFFLTGGDRPRRTHSPQDRPVPDVPLAPSENDLACY